VGDYILQYASPSTGSPIFYIIRDTDMMTGSRDHLDASIVDWKDEASMLVDPRVTKVTPAAHNIFAGGAGET
jgi:hypothetical protein